MAGAASKREVPADERKARSRVVERRRACEPRFLVARAAVLLEDALVRVRVAIGATLGLQTDFCRRARMAGRACERGVTAAQWKAGSGVIHLLRLPGVGRMASGARRTEHRAMRAAVAVGAGLEPESAIRSVDVTTGALHGAMGARQREGGAAVIEVPARVLEPGGGRMARLAVRAQAALVRDLRGTTRRRDGP